MTLSKQLYSLVIASLGAVSVAQAAYLDLSTWSALTLVYPGGQPAGNWVLGPDNTSVTQVVNADPSFYLNNLNQTSFSIDGSWQVKTTSDDDYMGFVFGYQNSSQFYLFDWKQGTQGYAGTTANQGMTIKKFSGATGDGLVDLSLAEFWENGVDFGDMTVLASNHGSGKGWADNTLYDFHLDFYNTPGEFTIIVKEGSAELWNVTVTDNTYTGGQFGFYNFSQEQVEYRGFEQTGGVLVPTPDSGASLLFLGLSLVGLYTVRTRVAKIQG